MKTILFHLAAACLWLPAQVAEHGFIRSAYFRDPDGYVVERAAKAGGHDASMDPAGNAAREILARWQSQRGRAPA